jgi:DeoR family transcriptional regulator, fructose operon transcriptional repressor
MNFQMRKKAILSLLDEKSSVDVSEFARKLKTSEITVRRDLKALASKGLVYRTHGGAMNVKLSADPLDFRNKAASSSREKEHIGEIAASMVAEGDVIFMDCGSTVYSMHTYLKSKRIRVITNSLPLANSFLNSRVSVNFIGGELDHERMATHGLAAVNHINTYKAMKGFVGVDGLSLASGLSSKSEKEAEITRAIMSRSDKTILLCDHSKFEQDRYLKFAPLNSVDIIITDNETPEVIMKKYRKAGPELINKLKK